MSDIYSGSFSGAGSLTFSSLLNKSKDSSPTDAIVREISELEEQIADVTDLVETLTLQAQDRQNRYNSEISELNAKIEKFKAESEREYKLLVESQDAEYDQAAMFGGSEVDKFVCATNAIDRTCSEWNNLSAHINQLQADIELGAVRRKFDRLQNETINAQILKKSRVVELSIEKEMRRQQQEVDATALHEEILRIGASARQQNKQYDILISECEQVQDSLVRYHKGCLNSLSNEAKKREELFERHLEVLKNRLKAEQEKCENELRRGRDLINNLNTIKRDASRRFEQQLHTTTRDIERINDLLSRQEQTTSDDREMMSKSETLQRTNAALTRQLHKLEEELERVNTGLESASGELSKSTNTPKKSPKKFRYSVF